MPTMPPRRRSWQLSSARMLAIGVIVGAPVGWLFGHDNGQFLASWAIASMYAIAIGLPASLAFRALGPRIHRLPGLGQWLAYAAVMLVVSAIGTGVVGVALVALGIAPFDALWPSYVIAFKIALIISAPMMIGAVTLGRLVARLYAREAELATAVHLADEARLASLESRIRPHFLFNALNSAIALIPEDPARAEKLLEQLAALLRFSLDAERVREVALAEELRVVRDYLEIERVRYGERLRYAIEVAPELATISVPAFAVQTLVENCVKYAVHPRVSGAEIRVSARRGDDSLELTVSDDGPGFAGEIWTPGHGLDGLRTRLATMYGESARLTATTGDGGAVVCVSVPA